MAFAPNPHSERQAHRGAGHPMVRRAALFRVLALPALALASGGAVLPAIAGTAREPAFSDNFRGMPLLDQDGKRFDFQRHKGRILLVHFIYTGCSTACPLQTRALVEMLPRLASPVRQRLHIVSVSLDPLSDSPAALKAFGQRMGVDFAHWSMVTGRPSDMERVAKALRLFGGTPLPGHPAPKQPDNHATRIWLADARGRLLQRYPGDPPDTPRLVREITELASGAPTR